MHPIETSSKLRNKKCGLGAQKGYRAWYHSTDACSFDGIEPAKPVGDWKKKRIALITSCYGLGYVETVGYPK